MFTLNSRYFFKFRAFARSFSPVPRGRSDLSSLCSQRRAKKKSSHTGQCWWMFYDVIEINKLLLVWQLLTESVALRESTRNGHCHWSSVMPIVIAGQRKYRATNEQPLSAKVQPATKTNQKDLLMNEKKVDLILILLGPKYIEMLNYTMSMESNKSVFSLFSRAAIEITARSNIWTGRAT